MGASPKTTEFLKECMADALLRTMKEKPYTKITVNEIAQAAGVNRSTWFRNFDSKDDAITFKLVTLWNRWADEHGMKERRRYTVDNTETFFAFNASIKDILEVIYDAERESCIYNAFYQVMLPKREAGPEGRYEARFYSFGLFAILDEWIKSGLCETPEQLAVMFRRMMTDDTRKELFIETKKQDIR